MVVQIKVNTLRLAALTLLVFAAAIAVPAQAVPNGSPAPASAQYTFPTAKTRAGRYVNDIIGPTRIAKTAVSSAISTWRNAPEEWGPTWRGAAKRFGSSMAKSVIKGTVTYSLDESLKVDSHFYRSADRSAGAKLRNALISPVTARNRSGKRVFGFPRVIGTYTSSIVAAEWWYPARYSWKDGVRSGTISLGMNAGFNLIKEFFRK